jgi:hypothetical protein
MSKSIFPTSIQDFASYLLKAVARLNAEQARLGVSATEMAALEAIYGNETTVNTYLYCKKRWDLSGRRKDSIVTTELATQTAKMKKQLTAIYNDIPASRWNDGDREVFGRSTGLPRIRSHPHTVIEDACFPRPVLLGGGLVKVPCYTGTDSTRASRANGADGIMVHYSVIDPWLLDERSKPSGAGLELSPKVKAPLSAADCSNHRFFTGATFVLDLGAQNSGQHLYISVQWYNVTHQELGGPCSPLLTLTVV